MQDGCTPSLHLLAKHLVDIGPLWYATLLPQLLYRPDTFEVLFLAIETGCAHSIL